DAHRNGHQGQRGRGHHLGRIRLRVHQHRR
ncbi:hypothetical protein BN1708_020075, partial [Verticillium longisporum]